jgi:hypothetical protein
MIADLPATVFMNGVTGTGALADISRAQQLTMTGLEADTDTTVPVRTATFSTLPTRNTQIQITRAGGSMEKFRVVSVNVSPCGKAWEIAVSKDVRT